MKPVHNENNLILPSKPLILYNCGHEKCKPSHTFGPAIRPHYLIHYILHGQGNYYVNGVTYHLKGGDGFLIYPGVTTVYSADEKDPWEYCWIGFDGYDIDTIFQSCGLSLTSLILKDQSDGSLWNALLTLTHLFTERQGNEFTYLGLLYQCFSHFYNSSVAPAKLINENYIEKAMEYIHHNYTYDIRIAEVAKFLSIDRTYLYKLFKSHMKISPQQYLIHYRLKVSQKLLKNSMLSMTEIAYSCGFKDASSFNKHFKKHFHITPSNYRSTSDSI